MASADRGCPGVDAAECAANRIDDDHGQRRGAALGPALLGDPAENRVQLRFRQLIGFFQEGFGDRIGQAAMNYANENKGFLPPAQVDSIEIITGGGTIANPGGGAWSGWVYPGAPAPAANQASSHQTKQNFYKFLSKQTEVFYCPANRTGGAVDMAFLVPIAGRPLPNLAASDYLLSKGANAAMCEVTQVPPAGRGVFDVNTRARLTYVADGSSNTAYMAEVANASS